MKKILQKGISVILAACLFPASLPTHASMASDSCRVTSSNQSIPTKELEQKTASRSPKFDLDIEASSSVNFYDETNITAMFGLVTNHYDDVTAHCNYTSSNPNCIQVTSAREGRIKAVGLGEATVTASYESPDNGKTYTAEHTFTVNPPTLALCSNLNVVENATATLPAPKFVMLPSDWNIHDYYQHIDDDDYDYDEDYYDEDYYDYDFTCNYPGEITCSYEVEDDNIASVSPNGIVSGLKEGTTTVTATCNEFPEFSTTCKVNVQMPQFQLSPISLVFWEEKKLEVLCAYLGDVADKCTLTSSDDSCVKVLPGNIIKGVGSGSATITASCTLGQKTYKDNCTVTVNTRNIQFTNNTKKIIEKGQTLSLKPEICLKKTEDEDTYIPLPADIPCEYSVDKSTVATVSQDGTVTAIAPGTAKVTITCGGITQEYVITVENAILSIPENVTARLGEDFCFHPEIHYEGEERTQEIWASDCKYDLYDEEIISVDGSGYITPKKVGATQITVQYTDAKERTYTVTSTVTVEKPSFSVTTGKNLKIGDSFWISAKYQYDDERSKSIDMNDCDYTGYNSKIISVSKSGKITAKGYGSTTVTVSYRGMSAQTKVTVMKPSLAIRTSIKMKPGQWASLYPYLRYPDGSTQSISAYSCSYKNSSKSRIIVYGSGKIYAAGKSGGTAVITVSYKGLTRQCKVMLAKFSVSKKKGKTLKLSFGRRQNLMTQINTNATSSFFQAKAKWKSSNKKVVSVSKSGKITAKKTGKCKITCKVSGKKMTWAIKVPKVRISYSKTKKKIPFGGSVTFSAKAESIGNKSQKPAIRVRKAVSSKPSVASVSYNVYSRTITVYGNKHGSAKIRVTFNNGKKKTLQVSVSKPTIDQRIQSQRARATISGIYGNSEDGYSADITFHNDFPKMITYIKYSVFEYDNRGYRLPSNKSKYAYKKYYNDNLSYSTSRTEPYLSYDARKVRVCIEKVWFDDRTTWKNPCYKTWSKKYKKRYGKD